MSSETNSMDQMPKKSPLSFQVDLKKFEKATDEEKRQQDVMSESVSFFKDGIRKPVSYTHLDVYKRQSAPFPKG